MLSASDFDLSAPASRHAVSLQSRRGYSHDHGLIHALIRALLALINRGSSYQVCVSGLSKEHARRHRKFHTAQHKDLLLADS